MRVLKKHALLRLMNSYVVDSPEPANISYLWNFGSLLGLCLIIQILTGAFLIIPSLGRERGLFITIKMV